MAEKILAGGKMIPWSTRDEFFIEASGTAGGLMGIYPLKPDSLTTNDVVILAAGRRLRARDRYGPENPREGSVPRGRFSPLNVRTAPPPPSSGNSAI